MVRYLALATVLVLGTIAVLLALSRPPAREGRDRYVSASASPGPGDPVRGPRAAAPIAGAAPWALSAEPACFHQAERFSGTHAYARAHLPSGARRVARDVVLHAGDCTLTVYAESAELVRGDEHLLVPAPARFYVAGKRLVLDQLDGRREEVRIYDPLPPSPPPAR